MDFISYLLRALSALIGDLKGQELDFHQDQGACTEFVIGLPGANEFSIGIYDVSLQEFGMNEPKQGAAIVREKARVIVRPRQRGLWRMRLGGIYLTSPRRRCSSSEQHDRMKEPVSLSFLNHPETLSRGLLRQSSKPKA